MQEKLNFGKQPYTGCRHRAGAMAAAFTATATSATFIVAVVIASRYLLFITRWLVFAAAG